MRKDRGKRWVPEVLADADADSDVALGRSPAEGGPRCTNRVTCRKEASLIKESVRWQVALARHMAHLTTLEQGGRSEESMVIGRFNK